MVISLHSLQAEFEWLLLSMSFQLVMQSRMVESEPCFYMLCSFIHTLEENAVPFKDEVEKMDLFIKCLSTEKRKKKAEFCLCRCISSYASFTSEAPKRAEFNFCKYIPKAKT